MNNIKRKSITEFKGLQLMSNQYKMRAVINDDIRKLTTQELGSDRNLYKRVRFRYNIILSFN